MIALRTVHGDWGVRVEVLNSRYQRHPFDNCKYKDIYVLGNEILLVVYDNKFVSNLIKHKQHKMYGKYFKIIEDISTSGESYIVTDVNDFDYRFVSNSSRQVWGRITQVKEYLGVL